MHGYMNLSFIYLSMIYLSIFSFSFGSENGMKNRY